MCGLYICDSCTHRTGKINIRYKCPICFAKGRYDTAKGLLFISTIVLIIGISLLFTWLFLDAIFLAILTFIFLPVGLAMLIISLYIFIKYRKDATDDPKKYLHKRYRRHAGEKK